MWTPQPHPQDHNLILLLLVHGSMTAGAHCRCRRGQPSRAARSSALPTRAALSAGACRMLRRPAPPRANRPAPLAPPPRCFAQLTPLAHVACSTAPRCRLRRPGSRPLGDAARSTTPRHPFRQPRSRPPQGRHTLSEPALCQDGRS
jgi:hypothetical protein